MDNHKFSAIYSSELFYNLFFDEERKASLLEYLENSFFDSCGIINLNNDTSKILYMVKNKYITPLYKGSFSNVLNFVLDDVIHPDDQEIYKKHLSPDTMLEVLMSSKHPGFTFFHHRMKLQDGTYRWVEQALITGEKYGLEEGIVKFYIYDIQNVKSREVGEISDDHISLNKGKDNVTSLYRVETFYEKCHEYVRDKSGLCLISIDIEHFKLFDEWYGRETGNYLLARIGATLLDYVHNNDGIAGYFGQDDFAVVTTFNRTKIRKLYSDIKKCISSCGFSTGFVPAFGICQLLDSLDLPDAYDKASLAADDAKNNMQSHILIYDPSKHIQDEEEYHLLLEFMQALKEEEITFFLQPQCRISTGKIVGAEALARWIKSDNTIIPPIKFVPVLEKYGFIVDLDQYIWDKVCRFVKKCLDNKIPLVPISINVSRVDIFSIDVADYLNKLIKKYQIPTYYIKVELTESAYAETSTIALDLVNKLKEMGFVILMDDFGSGYSSLNMLSDVVVDAIKLDAMFLDTQKADYQKSIHILESVVNMAKTIAIPIIVEGVETKEQKAYLENLGCRYAQGFYFYKPISQDDFINLIKQDEIIDSRGFVVKTNEQFRIREFLDENIYSDSMLNNILGPVAIYDWKGEQVDIVRFNEQFYETVDVPDFHSRLTNIQRFLPEEDVPVIYKLLKESMENKLNGSTGILHFYKTDGTLTNYIMRFYYLGEQSGFHRFYGMANNTTALTDLQEQMSLISRFSSESIIFLSRKNDIWHFNVAVNGLERNIGLNKAELEKELNDWTFFKRMEGIDEDRIRHLALDYLGKDIGFNYDFKLKNDDGSIITLNLKADPVKEEANNVEYILTYRLIND